MQIAALAPFLPVGPRVRRQSESDSGSGDNGDILSFLQGLATDSSFLKILICSSDQLSEVVDFSDVSYVSRKPVV